MLQYADSYLQVQKKTIKLNLFLFVQDDMDLKMHKFIFDFLSKRFDCYYLQSWNVIDGSDNSQIFLTSFQKDLTVIWTINYIPRLQVITHETKAQIVKLTLVFSEPDQSYFENEANTYFVYLNHRDLK